MNIECAAIGNGTVQLGTLRLESTTERLLPGEVAPMFERRTYPCGTERATSWFIVLFRRRLIVDFIRQDR